MSSLGNIDKSYIVAIKGVTPGECLTKGRAFLNLSELWCEVHIVPDNFPIESEGLLGWEVIEQYNGNINAAQKCLEFEHIKIPFTPPIRLSRKQFPLSINLSWISADRTDAPLAHSFTIRLINLDWRG